MADLNSTIEEGRAVWTLHEKTMHGQLQPRETANKPSVTKETQPQLNVKSVSG